MPQEGLLQPYRVLDLTDEKGYFCGKLLGDLGADVIKIEPIGGDSGRDQGPFYHGEPGRENSLFWFAYNSGKRGITLNLEHSRGQELLRRMVADSDFLIESFAPGYLDGLGIGYHTLREINPALVMVSITPFGQSGPYAHFKGPDIVVWAMGGRMYSIGDDDRPPTRISHHSQAFLQGSVEAACGAMLAFYSRQLTGTGQHVDVSIQAAAAQTGSSGWDARKTVPLRRAFNRVSRVEITRRWQCKNGTVSWMYRGGRNATDRTMGPFLRWMDREELGDEHLKQIDWDELDLSTITQEEVDRIEAPIAKFFASFTKEELLEGAVRNRIIFYPTFTTADILESPQLAARGYFVEVEHPALNDRLTYPGAFVQLSDNPITVPRPAPCIGEHNAEIYSGDLAMGPAELDELRRQGVI